MRFYPLDMEGYPEGYQTEVKKLTNPLEDRYNIKFHIPLYYESELEEGIKLGKDILNRVGIIKFSLFDLEEYVSQN